jgi:uncharacterized protein YkwD
VTCVVLSEIDFRMVISSPQRSRGAGNHVSLTAEISKPKVTAGLITLLLAAVLHLTVPQAPAQAASQAAVNLQKMLEYNNAERSARGIRSLSRNSTLDAEAQRWAEKLAAEGRMYHSSSTYALGVGFRSGAENLAYHDYSLSASQAHNMWMNSASHRRNMLDPAFHAAGFGIACSTKSGRAYAIAVVEFGGDSPPSRSTPSATPHVAGGQSMTGVGCSGSESQEPPPTQGSSKSPATKSVPSAPAPSTAKTPAKLEKQSTSPSPSGTAAKPKPSASPAGGIATKPTSSPTTGTQNDDGSDLATIAGSSQGETPQAEAEPLFGSSKADQAELAVARSPAPRKGAGRLMLTTLAAGVAYLFLIRIFGVKRPRRRTYSARHSLR